MGRLALRRLHRDERGVALVTAMLVGMVVLSLSLITVQLSAHNVDASSSDRKRVQAIHAAEAGLDSYLALLARTPIGSIQCTPPPSLLPIDPGAQFQITATYYPTYPGVVGQELSCPLSPSAPPKGAVITSRGTAMPGSGSRPVSRTMQTEVRLSPIFGGYNFAIFSNSGMSVQNNLTVNGYAGNDGDIYTNGNFACTNGTTDYGTVTTQGSASVSNTCNILQDLRANGNITMSNSGHVGHDATSSTGSITMLNSSRIDNNARAGTTCVGCVQGNNVLGNLTTSSPSPAPILYPLPQIDYVAASWQAEGYTAHNDSSCATAKTFVQSLAASSTPYVERIGTTCALAFSNNSTITLGSDLAIITNGSISTGNFTVFRSSNAAEPRDLHLIVPVSAVSSCTGTQNITFANNTDFQNVRVFVYTPCTASMNNNNIGLGGQIIGGTVNLLNHFAFTYYPMLVPGAGSITGYTPDIAYLREITNT